ncbi:hypothetical protein Tco_0740766 [Tanacetum coccineum]
MNNHLSENCYKVLFCKKCERTDHKTCDHAEYMSSMNMVQHLKTQGESSSRSQSFRPLKPFPPCKHYGFNDHQSDDCVNSPTCEICGSYDHDTKVHNQIISLRSGIKPRNPQHVKKVVKFMFDEKRGIIFKSNKEVVMIAPRVRDVYVLDMTSSAHESCFFSKASESGFGIKDSHI